MKYGIVNLTCNSRPYLFFDEIKRSYYDAKKIPYCFLYNEAAEREKNPSDLIFVSDCDSPQGIPVMLEKFVWSIKVLRERPEWSECDYWIRTNSSTFINLELLEPILDRLPRRRCYAGSICDGKFISGTCIILSKDLIGRLAEVDVLRLPLLYDDLVIRKILARRLVRMRDIPMKFFIDNSLHSAEEILVALNEYPILRINNGVDREKFDYDIWSKIAEIKV